MALKDEIDAVTREIRDVLWTYPVDMDRAKLLISKRMGFKIVAGEVKVRLKTPVVRVAELEMAA